MCVLVCELGEGLHREGARDKKRGCVPCFIAVAAPSGLLLIRVEHERGQPALVKKPPSWRDTDRGFHSSFIRDSHRAIL